MGEVLTIIVLLVGTSLLCLLHKYVLLLIDRETRDRKLLDSQSRQGIVPILDTLADEEDW